MALHEHFEDLRARLVNSAAARKRKEERFAPDFAVLPYVQPDENRLSQIIADLLDPTGNHGQGAPFLRCFLARIGRSKSVQSAVTVTCEDRAVYCADFRSRVDITIDFGNFGIGIENKPWATEGKAQLAKYAQHLDKKYHGHYVLVFVSPDGKLPESLQSVQRSAMRVRHKLQVMSYNRHTALA